MRHNFLKKKAEQREGFVIKISEIHKTSAFIRKKKERKNTFSDSKWCLRF